jgi:hypothetical protein
VPDAISCSSFLQESETDRSTAGRSERAEAPSRQEIPGMFRNSLILLSFLILFTAASWSQQQPWFFAVLSDPQIGMYTNDKSFAQETANFEFAVANLNRLHPRFVAICGDLVNRSADPAEIAEYKRILRELDPSIPVFSIAGNHDVGNIPTAELLKSFHDAIGQDYYTFSESGILGIVLDSNLIRSPQDDPEAAKQQEAWLEKTLKAAKSKPEQQLVVFQHIPYFLQKADEPDNYFDIPEPARRHYLDLLENGGVRYVFTGHYHRNAGGTDGPLTEVVTGAVGKPLGQSVSGFRIVAVTGQKLDSQWYCFGKVPNEIDPSKPLPQLCPQ